MSDRLKHAMLFAAKLVESRRKNSGFIYLVECHQFIKVGFSDNVSMRISSLQIGCPYELKLLKSFKTDHMKRDEAKLHALWKRYEVRGEWFMLPVGELAFAVSADSLEEIFYQP